MEIKKLVKKGKKQLVELCDKLGIEASMDNTAAEMATWIIDEVEDLNTWLEAKAGVSSNVKKEVMKKGTFYLGKCVKTGEDLYR